MTLEWERVLEEQARALMSEIGRGLLLSQVPSVLRAGGIEPRELLQGRKLRDFLDAFRSERLRLIQNEKSPALWALVPADAEDVEPPFSKYFPPTNEGSKERPPRFISSVWQAFVRPLPRDLRRWLILDDTIRFEDLDPSFPVDGGVEVDREFIESEDTLIRSNDAVVGRIEQWAAKHGVNVNRLLASHKETDHSGAGGKELISFLSLLSREDQARIVIPGDILAKLIGASAAR